MRQIAQASLQSLMLELKFGQTVLATGTGFVVSSNAGPLLVTNRHNVTGRDNVTGACLSQNGGIPDNLTVLHKVRHPSQFAWKRFTEQLFYRGEPRWIEHPTLGARADFVALPLMNLHKFELYPYRLMDPETRDMGVSPAQAVSVVGFPFGRFGGAAFPVWATGFIASEPDADYDDLPILLIDCRARRGQSGSPVILYKPDGVMAMRDGGTSFLGRPGQKFLGIYSGRLNAESDIGFVWKERAIAELVAHIDLNTTTAGYLKLL